MLEPYLLLGEIVRPQGIRGEVKVRHYTDDPSRFEDLKSVLTPGAGGAYIPLAIIGCRVHDDDVFLTLKGVANRDQAEALRGTKLYVDRAHAKALSEDEVFIVDILGATAYDTKGCVVGTLKEVLTPGGVDVFVFTTPKGSLMVPALRDVLLVLDAAQGKIVLDENRLEEVALYEDRNSNAVSRDV